MVSGFLVEGRYWQISMKAHQVGHGLDTQHMRQDERAGSGQSEEFKGDLSAIYNQLTRRCGGNKARFFLQMQERKTLQDKREPVQHSTTETLDKYHGKNATVRVVKTE